MRRALALLGLLAAPAGASAATVSGVVETRSRPVGDHGSELYKVLVVTVRAAPGEVNDLSLANPDLPTLIVSDTGAPLTAGPNCVAQTPALVTCSASEAQGVVIDTVHLGDEDDTLHDDAYSVFDIRPTVAYGGAGNDRMLTSDYITLRGQGGDDTLRETGVAAVKLAGGPGRDTLRGGSNDDYLFPGPGRDDVDGGRGTDTVSYAGTRHRVIIDLTDPRRRPDRMTSIEGLHGGAGDDLLIGDANANTIDGLGGDDHIVGGPGDDDLSGHDGADLIVGGSGNDFEVGDRGLDRLYGNRGNDSVYDYRGARNILVSGGPGSDTVEGENRGDVRGGRGDDEVVSNTGAGAVLFGGPGADAVYVNPANGAVTCGPATDVLVGSFGNRLVPAGCERVSAGFVASAASFSASVSRLGRRAIRLDVAALRGKGRIHITVKAGGRVRYDRTRRVDAKTLRLPVHLPADQRSVIVAYARPRDYAFSARLRVTRARRPR